MPCSPKNWPGSSLVMNWRAPSIDSRTTSACPANNRNNVVAGSPCSMIENSGGNHLVS
jgi:hypothetical protein